MERRDYDALERNRTRNRRNNPYYNSGRKTRSYDRYEDNNRYSDRDFGFEEDSDDSMGMTYGQTHRSDSAWNNEPAGYGRYNTYSTGRGERNYNDYDRNYRSSNRSYYDNYDSDRDYNSGSGRRYSESYGRSDYNRDWDRDRDYRDFRDDDDRDFFDKVGDRFDRWGNKIKEKWNEWTSDDDYDRDRGYYADHYRDRNYQPTSYRSSERNRNRYGDDDYRPESYDRDYDRSNRYYGNSNTRGRRYRTSW